MSAFSIGDLSLEFGEMAKGKLGTFYLSDGTSVDIPLMALRGAQDESGQLHRLAGRAGR